MSVADIMNNVGKKIDYLKELLSIFNSVVIIGWKNKFHTHRYIHKQWFEFFNKIHIPCKWIENIEEANRHIPKGSLIMFPDVNIWEPIKITLSEDNSYIFHRGELINKKSLINIRHLFLYEHRNRFVADGAMWETPKQIAPFVYVFKKRKMLVQPFGSPLLEYEFLSPTTSRKNKNIFFVGTRWWANEKILDRLTLELKKNGFHFIIKSNLDTKNEIACIRQSFASLAPGAGGHCGEAYLQCRIFKSISYGRLTFTDVTPFKYLLGKSFINAPNLWEAACIVDSMPPEQEIELCHMQQKMISNYTYLDMWINMVKYLREFNF